MNLVSASSRSGILPEPAVSPPQGGRRDGGVGVEEQEAEQDRGAGRLTHRSTGPAGSVVGSASAAVHGTTGGGALSARTASEFARSRAGPANSTSMRRWGPARVCASALRASTRCRSSTTRSASMARRITAAALNRSGSPVRPTAARATRPATAAPVERCKGEAPKYRSDQVSNPAEVPYPYSACRRRRRSRASGARRGGPARRSDRADARWPHSIRGFSARSCLPWASTPRPGQCLLLLPLFSPERRA